MDRGVFGLLAGEGRGEADGDRGEAGGERGRVHKGESLACSSMFFCWRAAFSTWSCVLVLRSWAFASRLSCRRAFASASCCSIESVAAFFLSRAVWAATRFFSFLLINLSSGVRWSKLALFLAGASSASCCSSLMSRRRSFFGGDGDGAGLLLPTTVATGRGLDESRGETEADDRRGEGAAVEERRGEVLRGIGARRSRDFCCPASIDWGMTMI